MTWKAMRHHLLQTTKDPVPLDEPKAQLFHPIVAKLLFLCKRSWPDLSTAIAFITTRVKCPDEDDYKKLTHVIRYLRSTIHLALKLTTSSILDIKMMVTIMGYPCLRSRVRIPGACKLNR